MRAAVWTAYGGPEVFDVREVETPTPGDGEILIRVRATTVTAGEVEMRSFEFRNFLAVPLRLFFGILKPRGERVLGQELAGDIVEVGEGVTRFSAGDRVFAQTGFRFGGHAQYAVLPADGMVAAIPEGVSYEEATTLPTGGQYALYFTRVGNIRPGQSVLINGGAGSIGSFSIQLAKRAGAQVTVVDSGDKSDFMLDLGADKAIDFEQEDFTARSDAYDLILDVIDKSSFPAAARSLKPNGTYLHTDISVSASLRRALHRAPDGRSARMVPGEAKRDDLDYLSNLVATGELRVEIDRTYPLEEVVNAHEYADSGAKRGNIVITVG